MVAPCGFQRRSHGKQLDNPVILEQCLVSGYGRYGRIDLPTSNSRNSGHCFK